MNTKLHHRNINHLHTVVIVQYDIPTDIASTGFFSLIIKSHPFRNIALHAAWLFKERLHLQMTHAHFNSTPKRLIQS